MKNTGYKPIPVRPLTGNLDFRSEPELMPPGSFRFRQNFASTEDMNVCRRTGWEKLLTKEPYNNQDLHDQELVLQQYWADLDPVPTGAGDVTVYPSGLCGALATRSQGREYVTLLYEEVITSGARRIIAATQSRIYELNESSGNWRILGDGFGGEPQSDLSRRFRVAQVKDTLVFTNNYDEVSYYNISSPVQGCAMRSVLPIPDMEVIGLQQAGCVYAYKNVVFLGNVQMDGQVLQNRLVWSDYNNPLSYDPAVSLVTGIIGSTLSGNVLAWSNPSAVSLLVQYRATTADPWQNLVITTAETLVVADPSLLYQVGTFVSNTTAGYQDLSYGQKIMAITELGDYLVVLTDKAIWQGTPTGNAPNEGPAFSFRQVYVESKSGDKCVAYPNTVTNVGGSLFWLGREAAYMFNWFQPEPERVEWMHRATGLIFNGAAGIPRINDRCCESHVADYRPLQKEIWLSWAVQGSCIPTQTMVFNVEDTQKMADTVDAGFTAFCNHRADARPTLRDFFLNYCICTGEELVQNGVLYQKEGLPLPGAGASCLVTPDSIYTTQLRAIGGDPANGYMEDYEAETASPNSLCTVLGSSLSDLCQDCNQDQLFIGAAEADRCLKQIGTSYNRETCTNPASTDTAIVYVDENGLVTYQTNIGVYSLDGYYSLMRTSPMNYGLDAVKKLLSRILLGILSQAQTVPCVVQVRIGVNYSAVDPNAGYNADPNASQNSGSSCGFVWRSILRHRLDCPNELTPEQYYEQNLVPNLAKEWAVYESARYFCYEVLIANLSNPDDINSTLEPALGGACCLSKLETWVRPETT